ncbi:MAG: recombinase family protein [Candidatus Paceibacterota bacterium]
MLKYFIYCRKSTESKEKQALSIETQLTELKKYARKNDLNVINKFTESKTAKEPGRPVFEEMIEQIKQGKANGILAWHPDRLARNAVDGGKIIHLIDNGNIKSLKFPSFWFEATPQGKFMLSVAFGQAKYYSDNLRENILRGIRQKLRKGEFPGKAPLGYVNDPDSRTIKPDPNTFDKIKESLEAFATGNYTLSKIRDKMFSLGLTDGKGKKLNLSSVENILTNPFYYGVFKYRDELHQGSYQPMISKKLFDKIQQALEDNGRATRGTNRDFLFTNFAKCGECGYSITAEEHIKKSGLRFVYYHCTYKSKDQRCGQRSYLREKDLAKQVKSHVQKVSLPDKWRDKFLTKIDEWEQEQSENLQASAQKYHKELKKVKTKLERLLDAHLEGVLETDEYKNKKNKLIKRKTESEQKLEDFEQKRNHWIELTRNWILNSNQGKNLALEENYSEMKNFLKKVSLNREIKDKKLHIDFKKPWSLLYSERCASGASATNGLTNSTWWTGWDLNP